jgi:mRNA interferase MazF
MGQKETISQYKLFWVSLDPTQGSEMSKIRPCVVVSPDEMNNHLKTVIIAPLTSTMTPLPSRVKVFVNGQHGMLTLDHLRSVSKNRMGKYVGQLNSVEIQIIKMALMEMFG